MPITDRSKDWVTFTGYVVQSDETKTCYEAALERLHQVYDMDLPAVVTGLRIGMSGGWISLVSAEMLGASRGLGFSILAYSQTFRFAQMYAIVLTIAGLGLAMNVVLAQVQALIDLRLGAERKNQNVEFTSPFIRYLERASGWNLDSLQLQFRRG